MQLRNIHAHALDGERVRSSSWSSEENQLHADPDQDNCDDRDNVMCAHDGSFGCECSECGCQRHCLVFVAPGLLPILTTEPCAQVTSTIVGIYQCLRKSLDPKRTPNRSGILGA